MARVLESGDLFFLYLPRQGIRRVAGLKDVARSYALLSSRAEHQHRGRHQEQRHHRLFSIHGLRLPDTRPGATEGVWCLLEQVTTRAEQMDYRLDPLGNGRAVVQKGAALVRPAGEGRYALVDHGDHQHLAYVLELPATLGDVQRELRIARRATYVLQVKAPDVPSPIPIDATPAYPRRFLEMLAPWELAPVLDMALLDFPMTQVYLTPTPEDVVSEIGLRPDREFNTTAETFRRLRLEPDLHPTGPLFTGDWQ